MKPKASSTSPQTSVSVSAATQEVAVRIKQQQSSPLAPAASLAAAAAGATTAGVSGAVGGHSGSAKHFFTPKPMAGPRPALARGGWASLAASTAAATFVPPNGAGKVPEINTAGGTGSVGRSGGNSKENGGDIDSGSGTTGAAIPPPKQVAPGESAVAVAGGAAAGSESWWVHRPAAVLRCLRGLLLSSAEAPPPLPPPPSSASSSSPSSVVGKGQPNGAANKGGAPPSSPPPPSSLPLSLSPTSSPAALVSLLLEAQEQKPIPKAKAEQEEEDFAAGLRRDPLHQLAGKMRLLLTAELSKGGEEEGGAGWSKTGVGLAGARAEPGLEEFISLVEDVHRSVERTTRQQ